MKVKHEVVYEKGSSPQNEDAYSINTEHNIFAVLDGATALVKNNVNGSTASKIIKEYIDSADSKDDLLSLIIEANKKLGDEVVKSLRDTGITIIEDVSKEARSSTGLVVIKLENNQLHFLHAGDCMLFVQYDSGSIRSLTYDQISPLDAVSIEKAGIVKKRLLNEGIYSLSNEEKAPEFLKEVRNNILPTLKENRKMLNTPSGYGIIDGSSEAEQYLEYGKVNLNNVSKILMLSDGLQLPHIKAGGSECWKQTAELAFQKGLHHLYQTVQTLENQDPFCIQHPRLKPSDDKTGILIELS